MSTLDRKIAPDYHPIDRVELIEPQQLALAATPPVYAINAGTQELLRVEVIFKAGTIFQPAPYVAGATNSLAKEGTKNKSSIEISEALDYYGAYLENDCGRDHSSLTLYSLNKHLPNTLPILAEIINQASFLEKETEIFIRNAKQKLIVSLEKVDVLARNALNEMLFGNNGYGYSPIPEDYDKLNSESLRAYFSEFYTLKNAIFVLAGKVPENLPNELQKHFNLANSASAPATKTPTFITSKENQRFIERKNAVQSAIRIGKVVCTKGHEDYIGLQVLNTVLGGYFGSRLMSNIREDKGLTYGIGSGVASFKQKGMFYIATEVGAKDTELALVEIYLELKRLREDLIPQEELNLVKNYMLGNFVRSADGPFALADKFKSVWEHDLDYSYFTRYFDVVNNINAEELRLLANKYLTKESMTEVVVGKR